MQTLTADLLTIYGEDGTRGACFDFRVPESHWLGAVRTRFADYDRIGVIAPTSWDGVAFWKAVMLAGKTPIMLQYPTTKLSRGYWRREVAHTAETLRVEAIAHWGPLADPGLPLPRIDLTEPRREGDADAVRALIHGRLTQLSSGTTGHRKGVSLSMADIAAHVLAYNEVLKLGRRDCVVSWLPLYHDMGFIAAFLMPVVLGVPLVLVDPVTWVARPELLFELIERHRGTVCLMPNFGFEVMARRTRKGSYDLSSMRQWISCSEPTRMDSMRRFCDATGTGAERIANCYAMAENIFAVTQSAGLSSIQRGGVEAVSCGAPIPGVAVKVADGEVWVRSPYSLKAYEGGEAITDAEGFYPTGDLGELVDGQLYILGRKRDVMIHAGRKIILSDVDHEVGRIEPQAAGRIATVPAFNPLLGTDDPVCLIEDERYWRANRDPERLNAIRAEAGLDQGRAEYVAPGFITKTSSGKINRALTAAHWSAMSTERARPEGVRSLAGLRSEILDLFPGISPERPFDEQLDSLGLVNLRLLLSEYGLDASPSLAFDQLVLARDEPRNAQVGPVIKVVSLFDADWLSVQTVRALKTIANETGLSIRYEHVCAPPAPILLQDLIFDEQFRVRDERQDAYGGLRAALEVIRSADLVVVDDLVQMAWPALNSYYPKISHRFEPGVQSDLMGLRWARYSERNHLISTELAAAEAIKPAIANQAIDDLEDYLGVPVLRVALTEQFGAHTERWPVRYLRDGVEMLFKAYDRKNPQLDWETLALSLYRGLRRILDRVKPGEGPVGESYNTNDQAHWCSWLINADLIDFVLDRYDSFLVLGKRASVPYLSNQAAARGKPLHFRSDLICPPDGDYACVLQTGSWGRPKTKRPLFPLMAAGWGDLPANVSDEIAAKAPPNTYPGAKADRAFRM